MNIQRENFISHLMHPARSERDALKQSIGNDLVEEAQRKTRRDIVSGKKPKRIRYGTEAAAKIALRLIAPALERNTQSISDRREIASGESFDVSAEDATVLAITGDVTTSIIAGSVDAFGYFPALGICLRVLEQASQLPDATHILMVLFGISLGILTKEGYNVATNLVMDLLPSQNKR